MTSDFKPFPTFELNILRVLSQNNRSASEILGEIYALTTKRPGQPQLALSLRKMLDKNVISRGRVPARPVRGGRWHYKYQITDEGKAVLDAAKVP